MVGFILTRLCHDVSASKLNEKTKQQFDFTENWVYKDLNVLNVLRRKKCTPKQQSRAERINFMPTVRVFVTVHLFLIICGPVAYLSHFFGTWRDIVPSLPMPRKASESGFLGLWCAFLLYIEVCSASNQQFFFWHLNATGEEQNRTRDVPYSLVILSCCTTS